jgi:plasmid stabilization system protein ParE
LTTFWEFIAADNIDAANRALEDVFDAIELLVAFPHQGYRRPELTSRPLRFKLARAAPKAVLGYQLVIADVAVCDP